MSESGSRVNQHGRIMCGTIGASTSSHARQRDATSRPRLEISWIYHDSALEGVVLSYSEIKAAIVAAEAEAKGTP